MKSNIKYYFRQSIILLFITVAYGALLSIMLMDPGDGVEHLISSMLLGCFIMNICYHISFYKKDIPMAISFGSTRKNLIKGLLFYDLICIIVIGGVISVVAGILMPEWKVYEVFIFATMVLIASDFLGMAAGLCVYKLGKVVGVISIAVLSVLGGIGGGFVSGYFRDANRPIFLTQIMITACVVIAVLWIITHVIQAVILRKYAY